MCAFACFLNGKSKFSEKNLCLESYCSRGIVRFWHPPVALEKHIAAFNNKSG